jgi:hypothetical protein
VTLFPQTQPNNGENLMQLKTALATALTALAMNISPAIAAPPMGNAQDIADAEAVWTALTARGLVGANRIMSTPYKGQPPHGAVLDTIDSRITVNGHTGAVIIKRNYGGPGVSKEAVANDPDKYLGAVTVMFKRENGYDPDDRDWFWAKYKPDGSLHTNPKGIKLAGRVAKGMPKGCIACHQGAPGGDFVFNNDRF